jgi:phosphoglycolate phosphatase
MKYKLLLFDFDGTLADTFPWFTHTFDEVADKYGFRRLDRDRADELRSLGARQIMQHHQVPLWKLPAISQHMRALMQRDISGITLFPGIDAALCRLSEAGRILALVSSNSRSNVLQVLGPASAARFRYFECGTSIFGKHAKLRKVLAASRVSPRAAILIGDELRDAEAATQAGLAFGAVAWGYTHKDALMAAGAKEVFESAEELSAKLL